MLGHDHLLITADGDGADLLSAKLVPRIFFLVVRFRFRHNPPRSDERVTLLATGSMPVPSRLRAVCRSNRRWCKTYVVLLTELLAEGSAHDRAALTGGGREVSL